jgi:hypothetical protein
MMVRTRAGQERDFGGLIDKGPVGLSIDGDVVIAAKYSDPVYFKTLGRRWKGVLRASV